LSQAAEIRRAPPAARLFRRSPHIVCHWADGALVIRNYATRTMLSGDALTLGLLEYFGDWRPAAPLSRMLSVSPARMRRALRLLVRTSMLHQSDRPVKPAEQAMTAWSDWNPEAGFFHFFTKDAPYAADTEVAVAYLRKRLEERPVPPSAKPYRNGVRIRLPAVHARDRFSRVLLARRTWRQFGGRPVSVRTLSTLMRLTFGTHKFLDLGAIGKAMLRTSPSAGACHPLEAYVVVRKVNGVAPGIYHYRPHDHELVRVNRTSRSTIARHLCGQSWYGDASFLVLITAVFARTEWKYPFPRAYRAVLLEAGHFCQTFCLAATAFRLAPFCSAALADSLVERDLRLDGVTESVLYACGVGTRPRGVRSAPWPRVGR
jgi:SagB-type dehydrogenase family enzyme